MKMNKYIIFVLLFLFLPLVSATYMQVNVTDFYTTSPLANYSFLASTDANNTLPYNNADNLTAWYALDSYTQTAPDYTGNGNTGTLNGYSWKNGLVYNLNYNPLSGYNNNSGAYEFTGSTSQNLTVPYQNIAYSSQLTIIADVYLNSYGITSQEMAIVSKIKDTSYQDFELELENNDELRFQANGSSATTSNANLALNTWYTVAVTYNAGTVKFYRDGTLLLTTTVTPLILNTSPLDMWIGGRASTTGVPKIVWNGTIDNVKIWNTTLNDSDIIANSNNHIYPVNSNGLVASYSFESNFTNATGNYTYDTNNLVAGQINGSNRFDNNSFTYVSLSGINVSNDFTATAWVYPLDRADSASRGRSIFGGAVGAPGLVLAGTTGRLKLTKVNVVDATISTIAPALNSWSFVSVTTNSGANTVTYCVNTTCENESLGLGTNYTALMSLIGRRVTGSSQTDGFNGSIDDVRIYNSSLSAEQIYNLYQAGAYRIYNYTSTNGNGTLLVPLNNSGVVNLTFGSNANGGYFTTYAINHNTSLNIDYTMYQSQVGFSATQKITNATANVNFSSVYLTNTTHYMYVQPTNITANGNGFYNKTVLYTPVALTSASYTITDVYDWLYNATAIDFYTNASLSNMSIGVCNAQYSYCEVQTITNGSTSFALVKSLLYNITFNVTDNGGYYSVTYLNVNLTTTNLVGTPAQSTNTFSAIDAITGQTLSATFNTSYLTNTTHYMRAGSYPLSAIVSGYPTQTILYNATALTTANYTFNTFYDWQFNLSAGLLVDASGSPVTFTLTNAQYGYFANITTTGTAQFNLTKQVLYNVSINSTYPNGAVSIWLPNYNVTSGVLIQ